MNNGPTHLQWFELHMKNGEVISYAEDYHLPAEKGLIGDFKRGQKKFLQYGCLFRDYYIPFDQISFIVLTEVQKIL